MVRDGQRLLIRLQAPLLDRGFTMAVSERCRHAVLFAALVAAVLVHPIGVASATVTQLEPSYVSFHCHIEFVPDDQPENPLLSLCVDALKTAFGAQTGRGEKYVAFSPGLLFTLNLPPSTLNARIVQALDMAERSGVPVFFRLDDFNFWFKRPDLFGDPDTVEWSAFPKPGQRWGPIVPRYWLNWGGWAVFPAPPPCFICPKFRADLAARLTKHVAPPIVQRLSRWRTAGTEHLFAGIAVGTETQVPDYRAPSGHVIEGLDTTQNPPARIRMRKDEMVRAGYAALHHMGHNDASLDRLAKASGRTREEVTTELLYQVAHDHAQFIAKTLYDAGVPKERLYTSFTSPFRPFILKMLKPRPNAPAPSSSPPLPPPVSFAINQYSRPGFTIAFDSVDLDDLAKQIALGSTSDRTWAAVETYATRGQYGKLQTSGELTMFLTRLVAHGARVANFYGINMTSPDEETLRGVRNWLSATRATGIGIPLETTEPSAVRR